MTFATVAERDTELKRILWALQDNKRALDNLMMHARDDSQFNPIRYAAMAMMNDGLNNGIQFARQAVSAPERVE